MKRSLPILATALLLGSSSVLLAANDTLATPATPTTAQTPARQKIMNDLQQAGFTDVQVNPDSFLVSAKDKSGNPVQMFISPYSVTEVSTASGQSAASGHTTISQGTTFPTIPANDGLSSKVVGLDIYNKANQDIGTIKDLAFNGDHLQGYIVGVGGFLGMGEHYVAITPSAVSLTWDQSAKKWHATMETNADQLKKAPEFKYPSAS